MPSDFGQSQELEELKALFAALAEEVARLMDLQADFRAAVAGMRRGAGGDDESGSVAPGSRATLVDELKSKIRDREGALRAAARQGRMSQKLASCEVVTTYKQAIAVLLAERKKLIS